MRQRTFRAWLFVCMLLLAELGPRVHGAGEGEMGAALEQFAGDWAGQVQVRALDGFVLKTAPATRRYSWREGEQVVETTLSDSAGDYVIVSRQAVRLGRLEAVVTRPGLPPDKYFGALDAGAIVWTNAEGNRRDAREQIHARAGASVLESSSVEPIRGLGLSGLVRIVGEFRRPVAETNSHSVPVASAPSGESDALRLELETERATHASLASRLDEAQRRASAAEARVGVLEPELEASRLQAGRLERSGQAFDAEKAGMQAEFARVEDELQRSAAEATALREEAVRRSGHVDTLNADLEKARGALAASSADGIALQKARSQVSALESTNVELQSRADAAATEVEALRTRMGTALQERDQAAGRADDLERRIARVRDEFEAAKAAAGATANERGQFERELAVALLARDAAEEQTRKREAEIAALATQLTAASEATRQAVDERDRLMQRALPLQRDNEALVRSAESLKATVAMLTGEVSALQFRINEAERIGGATGTELSEVKKKLAETEEQQLALSREIADARSKPVVDVAATERDRDELRARIATLQSEAEQRQRDNERLVASSQRIELERSALERRVAELEGRLATASLPAPEQPAAEAVPSIAATVRDKLVAEVQQMERRVLELESERNTAREQSVLLQRQVDEVRRLRDDTLTRFQTVVAELNAMREEKERLARANVSLQAEVRNAQQNARDGANRSGGLRIGSGVASPSATADGRTADMVVAGLQVIGVTRGESEDKAILDGRVYRNGDIVEPELGIVFDRIEDDALIFHDRRGREYRRRF